MSWAEVAGIAALLAGLVAAARWQRLAEGRIADAAAARRIAERELAGFVGGAALVAPTGRAALVAGGDTVALLERRGARVAVRRLLPPLPLRDVPEGVAVGGGGAGRDPVTIHGITADEVRALEASVAPAWRTIH